ncbi:Cyanovirin-N [Penicillium cf. griseofulvum]|nr:Cyanovirin-N [Penicillium cf. griseofulvum]
MLGKKTAILDAIKDALRLALLSLISKLSLTGGSRPFLPACESDGTLNAELGQLAWGDHEFSKKSQDVSFQLEGPNNDPMLYAQVDAGDGGTQESTVNLATCIKNEDGKLCFLECF